MYSSCCGMKPEPGDLGRGWGGRTAGGRKEEGGGRGSRWTNTGGGEKKGADTESGTSHL
jgi:hypothetical protein